MSVWAAGYLFLLGLACGIGLLAMTAFLKVTPPWLRWLLLASGAFVISRYAAMFALATASDPSQLGLLRHCWFATSLALPLQSVFAVDQLIRHPAMTPKKLLRWFAPFAALYGAVVLFGQTLPVPDRVLGWILRLVQPWQSLLALTHVAFVVGFVGIAGMMLRKIPVAEIRAGLALLIIAQLALTLDGLILAFGGWYFRPYLYSEMLLLVAIWHAFRTGATLP
jgi:hypothetical protein